MPLQDQDIAFLSISELSRRLRAREISAVELMRLFADRLERSGPRYNALALSLREKAIRKAKDVDDDLKRERFRSPVQGIPFAVKDLLSVAGTITSWGAKPYAAQAFDFTATTVSKLDRAGAVLIGKLAMVELAGGGGYRYPAASMFGPGRNPWDTSRWSGGSSSGSASAVAAGLVPYALGSETNGSIVTPCAFSGITGLRPTYGLVSRHGAMPLAWTMDKVGPMCRTAEDCGLVLQVIAGKDAQDPASAGKSFYFAPRYTREAAAVRVAFSPVDLSTHAAPATRSAFSQAFEVFRSMGVQMRELSLPDLPYGALVGTIIGAEGASVFEDLITSGRVDELADERQIAGLRAGLEIPARDYLRAMRLRRNVQEQMRKLFAEVDVMLSPARFDVAPLVSDPLDRPSPPSPGTPERDGGMRSLISAGNLAGLPALTLPCGFAGSLPVAFQLVGRPFSENLLIALGMEFQRRTDFHLRRPGQQS